MSRLDAEARAYREETILRIRRDIRAAQLRVTLDQLRGRQTPDAVKRLAKRTLPKLPSSFGTVRTQDGKLRTVPASRLEWLCICAVGSPQLRVALDGQRGRPSPEAVKSLAQRKLPTW